MGSGDVVKALKAVEMGADPQKVVRELDWRGMEEFVASACREAGMKCSTDIRLMHGRRRVQIDVVAATPSLCLVVDCKRWRRPLKGKVLQTTVLKEVARTEVLADRLQALQPGNNPVFFIPVIMALYSDNIQPVSGVFVLSVDKLTGLLRAPETLLNGAAIVRKMSPGWTRILESYNLYQGRSMKKQFGQALGSLEDELHKNR
ncbi:MAG: nuclease-related domain-containing protein [Candidatus Caldarchaeum sp.]